MVRVRVEFGLLLWAVACATFADLGVPRILERGDGGDASMQPAEGSHTADESADVSNAGQNEGGGSSDAGLDDEGGGWAGAGDGDGGGRAADAGVFDNGDTYVADDTAAKEEAGVTEAGALVKAVLIAVGETQACATIEVAAGSQDNGTVRCWGSNDAGQLGRPPDLQSTYVPLTVAGVPPSDAGLGEVSELALTAGYSCAVSKANGFLLCWGGVPNGLGVGRASSAPAYLPVEMALFSSLLTQVKTASVRPAGGCCTHSDPAQTLDCWGNVKPSGGNASLDGGLVEVGQFFESVVVGRAHACGITTDTGRRIKCWGANNHGQAGQAISSTVGAPMPVQFGPTATNVVQLAAGGDESCALFDGGAIYCWGANDSGQLGSSTVAESYVPVRVPFDVGDSMSSRPAPGSLTLGASHACTVILPSVWCWGGNAAGQLGLGTTDTAAHPTPGPVLRAAGRLATAQTVSAGSHTSCATLVSNGYVYCWGANESGQAGQPPSRSVLYATPVAW